MRSYELKPTYENLLSTYLDDTIARDRDIHRFIEILNAVDDCCSIALDGAWGSGKTFFVKQVKMIVDAYNDFLSSVNSNDKEQIKDQWKKYHNEEEAELQTQVCVYYDAWENDNDDDPILSLVYSIMQSIDTDFTLSKGANCLTIAATLLDIFSGKKWTQLVSAFNSDDPLAELRASKNIKGIIDEFLNSLLEERGNRLIIFIDELDRCKPDYTVRVLERIKHYFSNDRITFVFSTNINELQHTIKKCYGDSFNACKYLDRLFDLRVTLPPADLQRYYQSIKFNSSYYTFDIVTDAVIKTYHFELREIAKYIRLTKVIAYNPTHSDKYRLGISFQFGLLYITPIMIGLKVLDTDRYNNFIQGKDYTPMIEISYCLREKFFSDLLNKDETFDSSDSSGLKIVTLEDKLKEVYEALFVQTYNNETYRIKIGEYFFDQNSKNLLLNVAGGLSKYANYNL